MFRFLTAVLILCSMASFAQTDSLQTTHLNEVIVTGVTRATTVRKNPVPISVITKKEMTTHLNTNLIDAITKSIPGVSAVTTGPNISKPFIRGLGYNRVLTLYDGVRQEGQQWGDEHGIEVDQYGIGRVEVVKGPASLTYGSDAIAGVINMIPDLPTGEDGRLKGNFISEYQTNNGMIGSSLGLSYHKNDWHYVFRLSGKLAHNYRNAADGYVYGTAFRELNGTAMARVDKKWGYSLLATTLYNNLQEIPDGSRDSLTRKFTMQVTEGVDDDIKNRPIVPDHLLKTYTINDLHQHIRHYRLYNRTKIGNFFSNIALQQSVRQEYNHPLTPKQPGLDLILNTLNYDFRYNLPTIQGIEMTAGVNGMYQTNRSQNATDFPIPDYNLFDIGGFYFLRKSFGPVDVSGGIRYDHRHIHWDDFRQFTAFVHSYNGISGSVGATYNLSERLLLKANIARGYRAPNITEIGSNGLDPGAHIVYLGNRSFNPEFNLQEDIGFLAYLGDLDISVELFNNNITNYIYQARLNDVVIVPGNATYQYQQSRARLYGGEFSLNLHPRAINWLKINNSLAYTVGLNQNAASIREHGDQAKYLPFIPPLHARSEWKAVFPNMYGKIEVDGYARQNHFYGVDNTETATDGYVLLNMGAGGTIAKKFDLFFQVDNVLNTVYQANMNRLKYFEYFAASPNGRSGIYNIGRNCSIKVSVQF
ncbi:TonB-dependent receptor [[Flexibacter] sp. ATCC 35208]|uniref:TonB-dependent receptor n=1 Tax=[Flexibacter] sp. ATCC 35208 TaxID=1936242 RepID=UPI0009CC06D5|nr:TonB-dependent receptor [[Flexibacter] sp. ATCC 35208]OMP78788.1 energy transducer TonB [[Flexibacter] sp. ATCC 35208]